MTIEFYVGGAKIISTIAKHQWTILYDALELLVHSHAGLVWISEKKKKLYV